MSDIKKVTESERAAVEAAIVERLGVEKPLAQGRAGNSPYSSEAVVYGPEGAKERGTRIRAFPVCESHDGAGAYKGRGRTKTVYLIAAAQYGDKAVCLAGDRDSEELGASGFYVRPWEVEKAEQDSKGMGAGADAFADAFSALGL